MKQIEKQSEGQISVDAIGHAFWITNKLLEKTMQMSRVAYQVHKGGVPNAYRVQTFIVLSQFLKVMEGHRGGRRIPETLPLKDVIRGYILLTTLQPITSVMSMQCPYVFLDSRQLWIKHSSLQARKGKARRGTNQQIMHRHRYTHTIIKLKQMRIISQTAMHYIQCCICMR